MNTALRYNDITLINKIGYRLDEPERFDIVVFRSKYDYNTDYSYYGMKNGNKIVYRRTEKEYSDCFNYKYYNPYSNKKRNLKVVVRPILPTDNQLLENKVFGYNGDLKVVMKRTK